MLRGYHQKEAIATVQLGGKSRVVLEMIVGGKNYRTETGEVGLAIRPLDEDRFYLLSHQIAKHRIPLSDTSIEPELARCLLLQR